MLSRTQTGSPSESSVSGAPAENKLTRSQRAGNPREPWEGTAMVSGVSPGGGGESEPTVQLPSLMSTPEWTGKT